MTPWLPHTPWTIPTTVLADNDHRHGTANAYQNHQCRCDDCKAGWAANRRRKRAKARRTTEVTG